MRSVDFFLAFLLPLASLFGAAANARADDAAVRREAQFKAAYLFNFAKFVEWPASAAADTLTICFIGGSNVYAALVIGIENKRVGARQLAARQLNQLASTEGCNALYMDAASAVGHPLVVDRPVLTVSDAQAFASKGGMIELFMANNRLRFSINVDSAHEAGLRISSDLLKLAAEIQREEP